MSTNFVLPSFHVLRPVHTSRGTVRFRTSRYRTYPDYPDVSVSSDFMALYKCCYYYYYYYYYYSNTCEVLPCSHCSPQKLNTSWIVRTLRTFLPQIRSSPCRAVPFRTVPVYFTRIRTLAYALRIRTCPQGCSVRYGALRYHADICVTNTHGTVRSERAFVAYVEGRPDTPVWEI